MADTQYTRQQAVPQMSTNKAMHSKRHVLLSMQCHLRDLCRVLLEAPLADDLLIFHISMKQLGFVPRTQHIHFALTIGQQNLGWCECWRAWGPAGSPAAGLKRSETERDAYMSTPVVYMNQPRTNKGRLCFLWYDTYAARKPHHTLLEQQLLC